MMEISSNDFLLILFVCIISVNLIDVPHPFNTVHSCSRTYFEDQYLLIILVDSDIPNNDKVDNLFPRMTGQTDSKLYACFSSEASHSDPLQRLLFLQDATLLMVVLKLIEA